MIDILNEDLSDVILGVAVTPPELNCSTTFINKPAALFRHISSFDAVDVMTFTFNPRVLRRCKRVLYCKLTPGIPPRYLHDRKRFRCVTNLHAKLYLCYNDSKLSAAFAGSANCVQPTNIELMIQLRKEDLPRSLDFFNYIWRQA
jgi:hypothetical protein